MSLSYRVGVFVSSFFHFSHISYNVLFLVLRPCSISLVCVCVCWYVCMLSVCIVLVITTWQDGTGCVSEMYWNQGHMPTHFDHRFQSEPRTGAPIVCPPAQFDLSFSFYDHLHVCLVNLIAFTTFFCLFDQVIFLKSIKCSFFLLICFVVAVVCSSQLICQWVCVDLAIFQAFD